MRVPVTLACLLAAFALAAAAVRAAEPVALVLGEPFALEVPAGDGAGRPPVLQLYERLWSRLAPHYAARHGLAATPAEIEEAGAYHREFSRRDRDQRARKLTELEERIAAAGSSGEDRAWLEEFRAVLVRRAQRDEALDRAPPDAAREARLLASWVELWKVNQALYREYGGVVALTAAGPDPQGARAALIADYERQGRVRFLDAALRERLFEWLAAPPAVAITPANVDFSPYWKRPIVPSYFPD